jgi:hypothetical protein
VHQCQKGATLWPLFLPAPKKDRLCSENCIKGKRKKSKETGKFVQIVLQIRHREQKEKDGKRFLKRHPENKHNVGR